MKRKVRTLNVEIPVYEGDNHDPIWKNVIVVYQDNSPSKKNPVLRVVDIADALGKDLLPALCPEALSHIGEKVKEEITRRRMFDISQMLEEVA